MAPWRLCTRPGDIDGRQVLGVLAVSVLQLVAARDVKGRRGNVLDVDLVRALAGAGQDNGFGQILSTCSRARCAGVFGSQSTLRHAVQAEGSRCTSSMLR